MQKMMYKGFEITFNGHHYVITGGNRFISLDDAKYFIDEFIRLKK